MDNQEEELKVPKKKKDDIEEAITVEKDTGYSMISSKRVRRGAHKPMLETWNHDLDREAGDNDPHKRR
jgi:hypothetical protein